MVQGAPQVGQVEPMKKNNLNVIFIISGTFKFKLFYARILPFSTAVICHQIEKVVQGDPLSPRPRLHIS